MYGAELEDDEDEVEEELRAREVAKVATPPAKPESTPKIKSSTESQDSNKGKTQSAGIASEPPREGTPDVNAARDATSANLTGAHAPAVEGGVPKAAYDARK